MTDRPYELTVESDPRASVVRLRGEVDAATAPLIETELLATSPDRGLVLDLSGVDYLDSAGIAMLDTLRRARRLTLVIEEASIVARAVAIVGFDQLIPVWPSSAGALGSYVD
jgi:anti-anti-sigma factor